MNRTFRKLNKCILLILATFLSSCSFFSNPSNNLTTGDNFNNSDGGESSYNGDEENNTTLGYEYPDYEPLIEDGIVLIAQKRDLLFLNKFPSSDFRMIGDIDLENDEWKPLSPFYGTFDGDDYSISNLRISSHDNKTTHFGLFSSVVGAVIKNLHIENIYINVSFDRSGPNNVYIGGIAGSSITSLFENCSTTGFIKAETDIVFTFDLNHFALGGLVGSHTGIIYDSNSSVHFDVTINHEVSHYIGGIIGLYEAEVIDDELYIINCFFDGKINFVNKGNNWSHGHIGGILGYGDLFGAELAKGIIINSYSSAEINAVGYYFFLGGILGSTFGNGALGFKILNCYFSGIIEIETSTYNGGGHPRVGGIASIGAVDAMFNVYFVGKINMKSDTDFYYLYADSMRQAVVVYEENHYDKIQAVNLGISFIEYADFISKHNNDDLFRYQNFPEYISIDNLLSNPLAVFVYGSKYPHFYYEEENHERIIINTYISYIDKLDFTFHSTGKGLVATAAEVEQASFVDGNYTEFGVFILTNGQTIISSDSGFATFNITPLLKLEQNEKVVKVIGNLIMTSNNRILIWNVLDFRNKELADLNKVLVRDITSNFQLDSNDEIIKVDTSGDTAYIVQTRKNRVFLISEYGEEYYVFPSELNEITSLIPEEHLVALDNVYLYNDSAHYGSTTNPWIGGVLYSIGTNEYHYISFRGGFDNSNVIRGKLLLDEGDELVSVGSVIITKMHKAYFVNNFILSAQNIIQFDLLEKAYKEELLPNEHFMYCVNDVIITNMNRMFFWFRGDFLELLIDLNFNEIVNILPAATGKGLGVMFQTSYGVYYYLTSNTANYSRPFRLLFQWSFCFVSYNGRILI